MANVLPNLVDWARRADPDGVIADIAEMLAQSNECLKDMIWQEGNLPLGHKVTLRVALPQGTWRGNNQGVASTKSMTSQVQFGIGMLSAYSMVDCALAELGGEVAKFRYSEDMSFIEGLSQQVASALFYSNEAVNPGQFTGFAPNYWSISTSNTKAAANTMNCGGSGSSNSSMWLIGWGDNTTFGIFPKGSQAGLVYKDLGDIVPAFDSNNNQFQAYRSYFEWKLGLAIKNWQYNVRLANIDTTTTAGGVFSTTPPDLFVYMAQAVVKLPTASRRGSGITQVDAPDDPSPGISPAFYMNRTIRAVLDVQAIRDKNVLLDFRDYAGEPTLMFRDFPLRVVDALTTSEATLT